MKLSEYQATALQTDKTKDGVAAAPNSEIIVPLLGLAGEAGQLLSEYKKQLRDGPQHERFETRVKEELGDILWYVANVASKYGLDLDDIAQANLKKTRERFLPPAMVRRLDEGYEERERFPQRFVVTLTEQVESEKTTVRMMMDGAQIGAELTDNSFDPDGYRFHDVFHLGYAAVLGWSPVLRGLMKRKRRSDKKVDEVQDGGRAKAIDEGISAMVFEYARGHKFLEGVRQLDDGLLRTIHSMCAHIEVGERTQAEWTNAILQGFEVWRDVVKNRGGVVEANLEMRTLRYLGPPTATTDATAKDSR